MRLSDPAPELVTDATLARKLLELIEGASNRLILVSPFVDLGRNLVSAICTAAARTRVVLLFRADKLSEYAAEEWFAQFANARVGLGAVDRLHSKLYLNDHQTMIGSANLTHDSWLNSRELALVIQRTSALGREVEAYLTALLKAASFVGSGAARTHRGFCIRCAAQITLNRHRPYCREDWVGGRDEAFKGKHCHDCGKRAPVTRARPLCEQCYRAPA